MPNICNFAGRAREKFNLQLYTAAEERKRQTPIQPDAKNNRRELRQMIDCKLCSETGKLKCHKCETVDECRHDGVVDPCHNCIAIERCGLCDSDGMCKCCRDEMCKSCSGTIVISIGTSVRCVRVCVHTTCEYCNNTAVCCSNKCSHGTCETCEYYWEAFYDSEKMGAMWCRN